MSFETSDSSDLPYDTFDALAPETSVESTDYYPSPDIIPDQEANTVSAEVPEKFNPWEFKQIHYIAGGDVVEGDHPDPAMCPIVEKARADILHDWQQREQALETVPTRNTEFEDTIATAHTLLCRDFGEKMASVPIKVIDTAVAIQHGILYAGDAGRVVNGQLVVGYAGQSSGEWSERQVLGVALHEGAHERKATGSHLETALYKKPSLDGPPDTWQTRCSPAIVLNDSVYETVAHPDRPLTIGNSFFEEGLADSYRARTLEAQLGSVSITGTDDTFERFAYTDRPEDFGHYDSGQNVVYLPWKYARNAMQLDDGSIAVHSSCGGIAAYGIDILDQRLPGLYEEIQHMGDEPGLRAHITARIDSIEPGLYSFLRSLDYETADFQHGLQAIMRFTGMLDPRS